MGDLSLIERIAVWTLPVLFAITLHEMAHGWLAEKLGDKTARRLGRVTLNPIKHIDPIGTVVLPLMMLLLPGGFIFGYAKPVPVTWENLRRPKRDMALVALAGPGANLLMAGLWGLLMKLAISLPTLPPGQARGLVLMGFAGVQINAVLMVLNLLPLPPLDGSRVVMGVLPNRIGYSYSRIEPYGFIILLALLLTGVLSYLLGPPVSAIMQGVLSLLGIA